MRRVHVIPYYPYWAAWEMENKKARHDGLALTKTL